MFNTKCNCICLEKNFFCFFFKIYQWPTGAVNVISMFSKQCINQVGPNKVAKVLPCDGSKFSRMEIKVQDKPSIDALAEKRNTHIKRSFSKLLECALTAGILCTVQKIVDSAASTIG